MKNAKEGFKNKSLSTDVNKKPTKKRLSFAKREQGSKTGRNVECWKRLKNKMTDRLTCLKKTAHLMWCSRYRLSDHV